MNGGTKKVTTLFDIHERIDLFQIIQVLTLIVYWYITTELEDEQIRRLVANSLNVIFFHDSEEPFDPSLTENLGNVSQSFVVVQPWEESYRVGYYHKMDNSFPPRSPKNYLYGGGELKNFVMTKSTTSAIENTLNSQLVSLQFFNELAAMCPHWLVVPEAKGSPNSRNIRKAFTQKN